jgi:3-hydroxyisobutyrate dehydrogenase
VIGSAEEGPGASAWGVPKQEPTAQEPVAGVDPDAERLPTDSDGGPRATALSVGFIGLGVMGAAMAKNLLDAGTDLVVWNRTSRKAHDLAARVARTPAQVLASCHTTFLMLENDRVLDEVLGRDKTSFPALVVGRCLVNTGTVPPAYSSALAIDVTRHGGTYVEAPVSGSRRPAEDVTLVVMLAGDDAVLASLATARAPVRPPGAVRSRPAEPC